MREMKRGKRGRWRELYLPSLCAAGLLLAGSVRSRPSPHWIYAWLAFSSLDLCVASLLHAKEGGTPISSTLERRHV
jgi:hypothetical protein